MQPLCPRRGFRRAAAGPIRLPARGRVVAGHCACPDLAFLILLLATTRQLALLAAWRLLALLTAVEFVNDTHRSVQYSELFLLPVRP